MQRKMKFRSSTLFRSINILSAHERFRISIITGIQISTSVLDLIGIGLIGILGALAINGIESRKQGSSVSHALGLMHISSLTLQSQALIIGLLAGAVLITKTILSIFFTRKTLYFLSRRGALISSNLISKILSQPMLKIQERTSQEILYSVTSGVQAITLGVIGLLVIIISDGSLLVIMGIGLFIVDPIIAASTIGVFAIIGLALFKLMHKRASLLGQKSAELNIVSNEKIIEVLSSYRESVVRNRRSFYAKQIGEVRTELSDTLAELAFMPNISKYIIEGTVVIGSLAIGGVQFALKDAVHAIGTLTIFLAAGSRIAPAVLRVQQGAISIKASLGTASPTLDLIDSLKNSQKIDESIPIFTNQHDGFEAEVELNNTSFSYPGSPLPTISNVNLMVHPGTVLAVVGSSGAGKTTLIDILLGILEVESGTVSISGLSPMHAIREWPGAIAYVPQDVLIVNGTIRDNIALGYPANSITDGQITEALRSASLEDFVASLPEQMHTPVGERGARLSGGQRQRLGIARALLTKPKLLVLDEATSALDGETEVEISESIRGLRGATTVILIAHRLSTVKDADNVVYIEDGRIISQGTFETIRSEVPDFDNQAKLMGL